MSIGNLILGVNSVTVPYLIHYDSLLQNAPDIITKCNSYFITKCDRILLQNASGFLLQNATVLLQNTTVITNCDDFTTKCDVYYKLRQYNLLSKKCMTEVMKSINASFTNLIRRDLARERNIR